MNRYATLYRKDDGRWCAVLYASKEDRDNAINACLGKPDCPIPVNAKVEGGNTFVEFCYGWEACQTD
jgi:hypothetical protein